MNKIKHLILINVIAIMIVFSINVVSQASIYVKSQDSYNVNLYDIGYDIKLDYNNAGIHSIDRYDNIFCVQKGKRLTREKKIYYLKESVNIDGNTATSKTTDANSKNKSQTDTINGQLAYGIEYAGNTEDRQQIIWWLIETWKNKVGGNWSSLKNFKVSKGSGSTRLYKKDLTDNTVDVLKEAKSYANSLGKTNNTTNATLEQEKTTQSLTVRDNVNGYKEDGYNAIGPIKLKFQPKLANVTLTDISNGKSDKLDEYTVNDKTGEKTRNYFYLLSATKRPDNDYDTEWATPDGEEFIKSNKSFYIMIEKNYFKDISSLKIKFKTSKPKVDSVTGKILFWDCEDDNTQNMIMVKTERGKATSEAAELTMEVPISGSLKIEKVDKDNHQINLTGAKFMVSNTSTGWVYQNSDGTINTTWNVDWKNNPPTSFMPGQTINNLPVGDYQITEVGVPDNYKVDENCKFFVSENGKVTEGNMEKYNDLFAAKGIKVGGDTTVNVQIENKQKYISISGYVWEDGEIGKSSSLDDLSTGNKRIEDGSVYVTLWNAATGMIKEQIQLNSGSDGKYKFTEVPVEDLKNLYINFRYDGIKYTTVTSKNYNEKGEFIAEGSRGIEAYDSREQLNNKFDVIRSNTANSIKINNNDTLGYSRDTTNHKSTVSYDGFNTNMFARAGAWRGLEGADNAWLSLCNDFSLYERLNQLKSSNQVVYEINNVNLGLKIREKPSISILKDIERVKLSINGYNHIYNYDTRYQKYGENPSGLNVGVKFGNEYGSMAYTRPIYKSDYDYKDPKDTSKELQVYITYKIMIYNNTTTLSEYVNSIIDYCDIGYASNIWAGETKVNSTEGAYDREGNLISDGSTLYFSGRPTGDYMKLTINTRGNEIKPGHKGSVYVQFKLSREQVASLIIENENDKNANESKILDNIAEVGSYFVRDSNKKNYAGVDEESVPGNVTPGDKTTYENDTDTAPTLKLLLKDPRKLTGKVFLDNTQDVLKTGEKREGSGKYEENQDKTIAGVTVTLRPKNNDGNEYQEYSTTTNANGDFEISGFIPNEYELVYTWGGQKVDGKVITVQNYKGTIVDKQRWETNSNASSSWYNNNGDRYSDAIDNYDTRLNIDSEINNKINYEVEQFKNDKENENTSDKMESSTPLMNFRIENIGTNKRITTSSNGDELIYAISNVDFGIVERARQESEIRKRVSKLKLTLANGQVISEANFTYDKNGKLKAEGETKHMTFMGTNNKGEKMNGQNGFIKLELDNELIQGATLEATYEMEFYNKSELDYQTEQFYKYGIVDDKSKVVKQTPSLVIDYLDDSWSFEESKNEGWKAITTEELKKFTKSVGLDIPEETLSIMTQGGGRALLDEDLINKIENKTILVKASKDAIEPTATQPYQLKVSKVLTTTDDISLENDFGILVISKNGGRLIAKAPGKYVPGETLDDLSDKAEEIIVTPSTGKDLNFVVPITIGIIALITLGTGVILIKKKVIDNK